ncbi:MAG: cytoskeletal protein CcmA (bactofilin family) [Roseivirga sp.]|jgi:cytoskeletal protein CcmA (bactofilin family)
MATLTPSTHITQIKEGTIIVGNLKSKQSIRVDGHITGDLLSDEKIIIGALGEIGGNLKGTDITIEGFVKGEVISSGAINITAKARIYGEIYAKELTIEKGAELNGKVHVGKEIEIPQPITTAPSVSNQDVFEKTAPAIDKNDKYGSVAW